MSQEPEQIPKVLARYVSPMNAQALWRQALREAGTQPESMSFADRERVLSGLTRGLSLFVQDVAEREKAVAMLRRAFSLDPVEPSSVREFSIRSEADISTVRTEARRIAESLGANGFAVQKVTTIVSELARNIVSYTSGGTVALVSITSPRNAVAIHAKDSGSGIPHLDVVLSGKYRSRTGLGRGILGCKRLADRFAIDSGPRGTSISVEVLL